MCRKSDKADLRYYKKKKELKKSGNSTYLDSKIKEIEDRLNHKNK